MKKIGLLFVILTMNLMFAVSANATVYNGECGAEGDNVIWSLDTETGILEISGNGAMKDYTSTKGSRSPWYENNNVKKIIINDGITRIGANSFVGCSWVDNTVMLPDSMIEIGDYAFANCRRIPSILIPDNVNYIGKRAFSYCEVLCNVVLPNKLKVISDELFYGCRWTNSITMPDSIVEIGTSAFAACNNIKSINIPEGVISIGNSAFSGCDNLTTIELPQSLKTIGSYAFSASGLTEFFIPASVETIGVAPLYSCEKLVKIVVDVDNEYYYSDDSGVLYDKELTTLIQFPKASNVISYEVLDEVVTISEYAFYMCDNVKAILLPDTIENIGYRAFHWCRNLASINLPDGLKKIEEEAFVLCPKLTTVNLSDNITKIGRGAFERCSGLKSIHIPSKITEIEPSAFEYCSGITNLNIPDNITTIKSKAFYGCTGLKNLTMSKNVKKIENRAFQFTNTAACYEVLNLENVYYDGTLEDWCEIELISEYSNASGTTPPGPATNNLYLNGKLLEELIIPETFVEIKNFQFYGVKCIKKIAIPTTIKKIGTDAFKYVNPEKVIYNGTVKDWCNIQFSGGIATWDAYLGCNPVKSSTELYIEGKRLRNLEIPSGIEKIWYMAFYNNDKITNVFIPKTVKNIYGCAFYDCNNLGDVYYEGSEAEWKKITIAKYNDSLTNATIHYNSSPDDFGYRVRVLVDMPSMTIKEGKKVTAIAQLYLNGEVVNDDVEFTVVSSDPSVLSVGNFVANDSSLTFELNAIKPGVVQATVVETLTETAAVTEIEVVTGNIIFNSQYLPTYYERDQAYNCYSSGLYISDFKCGLIDDEYKVTFNAWNALSVMGVVCVYDADGKIDSVTPIKRFEGNMATSIKDSLYNGYKLIDDFVWGEVLTFKQDSYTKKTEIEVYVPEGGYIEITNNPMKNDYCATLNYVGFIFEFATVVGGTYMDLMMYEGVTDKFSYTILEELMKTSPELLKKFSEKLAKKTLKNFSIHTINDILTETAEDGLSVLNDGGIDILKIIEDTGESFIIGTVEKVFMKSSGCIGFVMNGLFKYSEFINITSWFIDLFSQRTEDSIKIWTFDKDGNFCDNGVKGNNVDDEVDLGAQNMVMRSVVISKEDKTEIDFDEVFKKIADEYIVRDIYFQCNGDIMQPGQRIQISIPVPKEFDPELCAIFWVREDGTVEKMDAEYNNGYMQFIATHFSYYAIAQLHVHDYTSEVVIEPTCENNGLKKYTCTCDETYTESIEVNDHSLGSWYVVTPSKCETIGLEQRECSVCDYTETQQIHANGHDFDGSSCKNCDFDKADTCDCKCHKTGFISKIIWFITNFFNKLLKKNKLCNCGTTHF